MAEDDDMAMTLTRHTGGKMVTCHRRGNDVALVATVALRPDGSLGQETTAKAMEG